MLSNQVFTNTHAYNLNANINLYSTQSVQVIPSTWLWCDRCIQRHTRDDSIGLVAVQSIDHHTVDCTTAASLQCAPKTRKFVYVRDISDKGMVRKQARKIKLIQMV